METERIPLFPLEVVLFPSTPLPLHIFELRYKLMIQRCLDQKKEFGVILARQERIAPVGCTAEILKVMKTYPDGKMDILTVGQDAYRVLQVFEEEPYLEGSVEILADDAREAAAETRTRLVELYTECYTKVYGRAPEAPEKGADASLAYHIAGDLPLDLEIKQALLETRTEAERQTRLTLELGEWLPKLAHLDRMRAKAGGNGHGLPHA